MVGFCTYREVVFEVVFHNLAIRVTLPRRDDHRRDQVDDSLFDGHVGYGNPRVLVDDEVRESMEVADINAQVMTVEQRGEINLERSY